MKIVAITPKTPAEAMGIQVGDDLLSINDRNISDEIDYTFYAADEELKIKILRDLGKIIYLKIYI